MKMKCLSFCLLLLAVVFVAGCGKNKGSIVKPSEISVASIAAGAKTKSGKMVDAYEITLASDLAVVLVVGGGKLEKDATFMTLNGKPFLFDTSMMKNAVMVVDCACPGALTLPNVKVADAKAKCSTGKVIDLPIDELLATPRPGMPIPK